MTKVKAYWEMRISQRYRGFSPLEEAGEAAVRELEAKLRTVDERLEAALARVYNVDTKAAAVVATLCDDELDRSGAMLGRVRDHAHFMRLTTKEEE